MTFFLLFSFFLSYKCYNIISLVGKLVIFMDFTFNSKEELYQMIEPALDAKKSELDRLGYRYIHKNDVWNYLILTKWTKAHNLELSDIVSDILNCDNNLLDKYLKDNLTKERNIEII